MYLTFLVDHRKDSVGFREAVIQGAWKNSERLVLRAGCYVSVHYVDTEDIPEDAWSLSHYGEFTALNWSKWLKF